jgi:hypothetical protein
MKLTTALRALNRIHALRYLTFSQVSMFIRLSSRLKRDILQPQPIEDTIPHCPPTALPPSVSEFLSDALGIPLQDILVCWDLLKKDVWEAQVSEDIKQDDLRLFKEHGHRRGLSAYSQVFYYTQS